jgi:death-on-curing protein
MISIAEVVYIHSVLIERFGGASGLRDLGLLESALARPFQTFDGNELYEDPIHKAAAFIESLLVNLPFLDGNKRIGYVIMRLYLMEMGFDLLASQDEKYEFVIQIASGQLKFAEITQWIKQHTHK